MKAEPENGTHVQPLTSFYRESRVVLADAGFANQLMARFCSRAANHIRIDDVDPVVPAGSYTVTVTVEIKPRKE